jgi:uncharacterized protein YbaR (Trm112 family)/SAM-dependent methyltransferase
MRENILAYVVCPLCRSTHLQIVVSERDEIEIREGELACADCDAHYPVHKGIIDLLANCTPTIQSEQKGWIELLGETTDDLFDTMLRLPYVEDDIWITTHENFDQVMSTVDLSGKRVLDVGAGRCWSTRHLMRAGASYGVALDILAERFIGLETADILIEHDGRYFERILADMNNLPMLPMSFDIVFMTATLHHSSNLVRTMHQVATTLAPDGIAIVVNEPVQSPLWPTDLSNSEEIAHGINENAYYIFEYLWAALCAGLRPRLFFPRSIERGLVRDDARVAQEMGSIRHRVISHLWRYRAIRRALCGPLLPAIYLIASLPLVMIARKR